MIAALRAMGWLRWRLLRNELRSGKSRDTWERLSRIGAVLTPVLLAVLLIPSSIALILAGAIGAWLSVVHDAPVPLSFIVRGLLFLVVLLIVVAPVMRSIQGSRMNIDRLRLLPFSRRVLHLSEIMSGFADPWVTVTSLTLVAIALGMLAAGAFVGGLLTLVAALLMILVLLLATSVCASGAILLFRKRRRAEAVTLVLVLVLSGSGLVPLLMESASHGRVRLDEAGEQSSAERNEQRANRRAAMTEMIRFAAWVPSEQFGKGIEHSIEGDYRDTALQMSGLLISVCVLYLISSWAHARVLGGAESSGRRSAAGELKLPRTELRLWPGGASALGLVGFRTPLRTVRGKLAVYFTFLFVVLLYVLLTRAFVDSDLAELELPLGPMALFVGILLTQLSLQPLLANMFALDGAGLTLITLAPLSDRQIVHGKQTACALLSILSWLLCWVGALLVEPASHPIGWLTIWLVGLSSLGIMLPLSAAISAMLPKTADLSRVGKAGNPHPTAGLVSFLITLFSLAVPAGLCALLYGLTRNWLWTLLGVGVWTAITAVAYPLLSRLPMSLLRARRENLLLVAGGR